MHKVMLIDLHKCVGCGACSMACKASQGTPVTIHYHRLTTYEVGIYPQAKLQFLPMPCMHCQDAPCLNVCPSGATYRGANGSVQIKSELCIGCRACMQACPYGSRQFLWQASQSYWQEPTVFEQYKQTNLEQGTVVKCDFCAQRETEHRACACVEACPVEARQLGDLDNHSDPIQVLIKQARVLLPEHATSPSIYYLGLLPLV